MVIKDIDGDKEPIIMGDEADAEARLEYLELFQSEFLQDMKRKIFLETKKLEAHRNVGNFEFEFWREN